MVLRRAAASEPDPPNKHCVSGAGLNASIVTVGKEKADIGASMVRRRRTEASRRTLLLNLTYDDFRDDTEVMDDGGDAIEPVANDDALVVGLSSLELSDAGCVDWEIRDGEAARSGSAERFSAET